MISNLTDPSIYLFKEGKYFLAAQRSVLRKLMTGMRVMSPATGSPAPKSLGTASTRGCYIKIFQTYE